MVEFSIHTTYVVSLSCTPISTFNLHCVSKQSQPPKKPVSRPPQKVNSCTQWTSPVYICIACKPPFFPLSLRTLKNKIYWLEPTVHTYTSSMWKDENPQSQSHVWFGQYCNPAISYSISICLYIRHRKSTTITMNMIRHRKPLLLLQQVKTGALCP